MNEDQLSISTRIEIDKRSSMNDIGSFLESVKKNSVLGISLDSSSLEKQLKETMNKTINFDKDGLIKNIISTIKTETGQLVQITQKLNEKGDAVVVSSKLVNDELKEQKIRYEEIRALHEKLGKLQSENVNATKKKKESINSEINETKKLIKEKEKALKLDGLGNENLQLKVDAQKIKNQKLIQTEEDKLSKKRDSNYSRLTKAMELEHKYNLQSISANKQELEVLNKKKAIVTSSANSARSSLWRNGLNTSDMDTMVKKQKEINELELKAVQYTNEQKNAYNNLKTAQQSYYNAMKNYTSAKTTQEKTTYNNQVEKASLEIAKQKQIIEEKGLQSQQLENDLATKRVSLENQLAIVNARVESSQEQLQTKHLQYQRQLEVQISKLKNGKNGEYLTAQDIAIIEKAQTAFKNLNATSTTQLNNSLNDTKLLINEIDNNANNTRLRTTVTNSL